MILTLARAAMGTRFELVLIGADEVRLRAAGEAALDEVELLHQAFSLFDPSSRLSDLNRRARTDWVRLEGELWELIELADRAHAATRGHFDPVQSPKAQSLAVTSSPTWSAIELDREDRRIRFQTPDLALDLGGIAKGYALDLAGEALREAGVETAMLHGGTSSSLALGRPPGLAAWRIGLGDDSAPVAALCDATLSVSASDPRSSHYATHLPRACARRAAVHVRLDDHDFPGAWCDAWSTALLLDPTLPLPPELNVAWSVSDEAPWNLRTGDPSPYQPATPLE